MFEAGDPQLLSPQSYLRVHQRTIDIRQSSQLFGRYVMDNQLEYSKYATRTRQDCEFFEQSLQKSGFQSNGRTEEISSLVRLFQEVALTIQKMSTINMIGLKGLLGGDQAALQDEQFRKGLGTFLQELEQFSLHEQQTQKIRNSYRQKCAKLNEALEKCSGLSEPTQFYNPDICQEITRQTEERYKAAANKQLMLAKEAQDASLRRRRLQYFVKDLKNNVVVIVKFHIGRICEMMGIVLDSSHWEKEHCGEVSRSTDMQLFYNKQMERFGMLYRTDGSRAYMTHDLSRVTNANMAENFVMGRDLPIGQIHQDNRMFLERCQTFINAKNNQVFQSITIKKQLYHFLELKLDFMKQLRTGMDQVNERCFGPGQKDIFRQRLVEFFGTTLAEAFQIVQTLIAAPIEIIQRVEKVLLERLTNIRQIIHSEQQQSMTFQRDTSTMFIEHRNLRTHIYALSMVPSQTHQQFVSNIKVTFLSLRAAFNNINEKELQLGRMFAEELKLITTTMERQCFRRFIKLKMEREQGTYDSFRRINVDSEVLRIVGEDPTYRVLFHEFYKAEVPQHPQLRSEINTAKYQKMRQLLEQKEIVILNDRNRPFITSGCCVRSSLLKNYPGTTVYKCYMYQNGELIKGKLIMLREGIHWVSKPKTFFFGKKDKLVVPSIDIRSFELKDISPDIKDCIVMHTKMGELTFTRFQNRDEAYVLLTKLFPANNREGADTDSRSSVIVSESKIIDKSMMMNTSKILLRKGTTSSSMLPSTPATQVPPLMLQSSTDPNSPNIFAGMLERWLNMHNFFREMFVIAESRREDASIRSIYNTSFCGVLTSIREFKQAGLTNDNSLEFNFSWKVSFPEVRSIKSFVVSQFVRVCLQEPIVKIYILTKKPCDKDSYMQDVFFDELKIMNKSFGEFIVCLADRECELVQEVEMVPNSNRQIDLGLRRRDNSIIEDLGMFRKSESLGQPMLASTIRREGQQSAVRDSVIRSSIIKALNGSPERQSNWQPYTSQFKNGITSSKNLQVVETASQQVQSPYFSKVGGSPPNSTDSSVPRNRQGSPQQVFIILTAYFLLFLALYVF